ncbi:MAG: hypothetical protein ACJA0J_002441 [Bdellovibrionota bacterium]|jgi:hypothetical protein
MTNPQLIAINCCDVGTDQFWALAQVNNFGQ